MDFFLHTPTADEMIRTLALEAHPEGGWYRETYRHVAPDGSRGAGTAIFYLLRIGEISAWHRVDATEIWHFYGGAPLALTLAAPDEPPQEHTLGADIARGQRPQLIVPAGVWQTAQTLGAWTLVGCTVTPAFRFEGFELAPPGWQPTVPVTEP